MAKSLIISFQYNIESVYFFYSNPVYCFSLTSATMGDENANYGGRSGSVRVFAILQPRKYQSELLWRAYVWLQFFSWLAFRSWKWEKMASFFSPAKYIGQFILKYHQEKPFLTCIIHLTSDSKGDKFKGNFSKTSFFMKKKGKKKKEEVN